ncbi:MAG: hypothetical protein H6713_35510 [Myxococcales bacterium]|nr:hypothetical protein [Myxococcales bacterium]
MRRERVRCTCLFGLISVFACAGDDAGADSSGSGATTSASAGASAGGSAATTTATSGATSGGPSSTTAADSSATSVDPSDATTSGESESATTGVEPPPELEDMSLGPYPSALELLLASLESNAASLDTQANYSQSAGQGYVLQATAALLEAARGRALPGGEDTRDELVALALGELEELMAVADLVVGGGPAFGLEDAWDAFGDGSTNPAYTAYSWQSGMVALGIAELLAYIDASDGRHDDQADRVATARAFLGEMLTLWNARYTELQEDGETLGYFWYSTEPADAKAVHNTSALVAMASQLHFEATDDPSFAGRPEACARLLRKRATTTPAGGYTWSYVDDGWPIDQRQPEDVSHALVTLQFIRFAGARGWWSDADMARIAKTLRLQMWSGNPARLHGRVDGSSGGESEWSWTRAAVIGFAVHGDAPGGEPAAFDFARSLLVSSYLTPYERPLVGATVDAARALALARMFERRPDAYAPDSRWLTVAGPGDDALPETPGGVRFYTVDWGAPADLEVGALTLPARSATATNANLLVDLELEDERPVVVSLTYAAADGGVVQEWDGAEYHPLAPLPATLDQDGERRWMRTSFLLNPAIRHDYQPAVVGTNVLLQTTSLIDVNRIEATPWP